MAGTVHGESFKEKLDLLFNVSKNDMKVSEWICENTYLRGKKYNFKNHEYQIAIADDKHRNLAAEKCAQIGFTEILIRWALCFSVQHQGCQTIFTQPTAGDMAIFAKSRFDVLLEECPVVKKLGTGGVDSMQLKRIGNSFINLRGTFGTRAAISVPSDANVYDEVNFSNPRVLNQYKSRLQHSEYKLERNISTPTIPNYGVSKLYNVSDKKRIFTKCNHCGHQQLLTWPGSIRIRRQGKCSIPLDTGNGEVDRMFMDDYLDRDYDFEPYIACIKCERELDRSWAYQQWVAEFPEKARDLDAGVSGYKISQLDIVSIPAKEIVKKSDKRFPEGYLKYEDFQNFGLGNPYAGGENMKITEATKVVGTHIMERIMTTSGSFIGIDLGAICHCVVIKDFWLPGKLLPVPIVVATFEIKRQDLETELPKIMDQFGALYTVSDAQPYTTTVEKIAMSKPGRMSICFYGGKKAYAMSDVQVTANRTQTLDAVTEDLPRGLVLVASSVEHYDIVWKHLQNLVKVKVEEDDGTEYYDYVKIGDDHFGHAVGYGLLARRIYYEVRPDGMTGAAMPGIDGHRSTL